MSGIVATTVGTVMDFLQEPPDGGGGSNVPQPHADPSGFPGQQAIETVLNVLSWAGLAAAVGAVLVGGLLLGIGNVSANGMLGSRGKTTVLAGFAGGIVVALAGRLISWGVGLA